MSTSGYPQWSGGPEGYPVQGPDGPPPARGNGLAVAALVLGILAIVLFWTVFGGIVLGIIAVVFGIVGILKARGGRAPRKGMAITGLVLGALGLIASAVILAVGVSFLNSDSFKDYKDCVEHAQSQSDRDQCTKDFSDRVSNN